MKTEQVNLRLDPELLTAIEQVASAESLDRGTAVRRLLQRALADWRVERALRGYQSGDLSIGRAAEEANLTQWELLVLARDQGVAYPLTAGDVASRLSASGATRTAEARAVQNEEQLTETLEDRPPREGGVLLVGINPAPLSVRAGHYYQGTLGRRLWRRLERLGLLADPVPGQEDDAFVRAGHGLTDLVKRPTAAASELESAELRDGARRLEDKISGWRPALVVFVFKRAAATALEDASVRPGPTAPIAGVKGFLLSGPYVRREDAERVDAELRRLLRSDGE
jgi:TDG/mug DNA glycosylase family protein